MLDTTELQWSFKIAGITFEGRRKKVLGMEVGDDVYLLPEPNNIHDKNAVAVYRRDVLFPYMFDGYSRKQHIEKGVVQAASAKKAQIGYVPKEVAASMQKILLSCDSYDASVQEIFYDKMGGQNKILGIRIRATTYYNDAIAEEN